MTTRWRARAAEFFALDDDWVRPTPHGAWRTDAVVAALLFATAALSLELARSGGAMSGRHAVWQEYAGLVAMSAVIGIRRRWPLTSALLASAGFFVVGVTMPDLAVQISVQVLYFYALFSAMAWAASRQSALIVMGVVLVAMFGWLAWQFSIGRATEAITSGSGSTGPLSPVVAAVVFAFLINVAYFGGAVLGGQAAWRAARRRAALADQARRLRTQSAELKEHAVVQERLRIARELHDVVAHHVSVMGVQAAAARRVLAVDPAAASTALGSVESTAREAVTEMRALLGTLRQGEREPTSAGRAPEPSVDAIPALVQQMTADGLTVTYAVVADPPDAVDRISPAAGLTLYRTVQEALHNVRRHSTATSAGVVLRLSRPGAGPEFAEVEVLDAGRPRTGTSGTGLGLLGMRERVASLDGSLEIGPSGLSAKY
jgi:signal transduction histidine kinase